jgi:uncharacterized protein (DUF2062 family)
MRLGAAVGSLGTTAQRMDPTWPPVLIAAVVAVVVLAVIVVTMMFRRLRAAARDSRLRPRGWEP